MATLNHMTKDQPIGMQTSSCLEEKEEAAQTLSLATEKIESIVLMENFTENSQLWAEIHELQEMLRSYQNFTEEQSPTLGRENKVLGQRMGNTTEKPSNICLRTTLSVATFQNVTFPDLGFTVHSTSAGSHSGHIDLTSASTEGLPAPETLGNTSESLLANDTKELPQEGGMMLLCKDLANKTATFYSLSRDHFLALESTLSNFEQEMSGLKTEHCKSANNIRSLSLGAKETDMQIKDLRTDMQELWDHVALLNDSFLTNLPAATKVNFLPGKENSANEVLGKGSRPQAMSINEQQMLLQSQSRELLAISQRLTELENSCSSQGNTGFAKITREYSKGLGSPVFRRGDADSEGNVFPGLATHSSMVKFTPHFILIA